METDTSTSSSCMHYITQNAINTIFGMWYGIPRVPNGGKRKMQCIEIQLFDELGKYIELTMSYFSNSLSWHKRFMLLNINSEIASIMEQ